MKKFVCMGAMLQCSNGMSPCPLVVVNPLGPSINMMTMATVTDFAPFVNIASFGMCRTQSNPTVAAATAAAQGVLTPMPCIPVIPAPWSPGASVKIGGKKALLENSKCKCTWGGSITIKSPGNTKVEGQ